MRGYFAKGLDRLSQPSQACYTCPVRVITQHVRVLRRAQTDAERVGWYLLRGRKLAAKFRRQCSVENWAIDFGGFEHRLAIELNAGVHSQPGPMRRDAAKEDYFRARGIGLLRLANGMAVQDPGEFLRKVREAIASGEETTPHPSRGG